MYEKKPREKNAQAQARASMITADAGISCEVMGKLHGFAERSEVQRITDEMHTARGCTDHANGHFSGYGRMENVSFRCLFSLGG
eukprot:2617023-Amphidinium_carterae.3